MSLIYLATPYTHFPGGLQAAFEAAARVTAGLMQSGFIVYSPICHSHPVARTGLLDAVNHELWMRIDRVMMDRCDMLLVAKLPTWETSKGVAYEIDYFREAGKPVGYLEIDDQEAEPNIPPPHYNPDDVAFRRADWSGFVHESTKSNDLGNVETVDNAHPMRAEALRMADEEPCNQPSYPDPSAWTVNWPAFKARFAPHANSKPDAGAPAYQTLVGN